METHSQTKVWCLTQTDTGTVNIMVNAMGSNSGILVRVQSVPIPILYVSTGVNGSQTYKAFSVLSSGRKYRLSLVDVPTNSSFFELIYPDKPKNNNPDYYSHPPKVCPGFYILMYRRIINERFWKQSVRENNNHIVFNAFTPGFNTFFNQML